MFIHAPILPQPPIHCTLFLCGIALDYSKVTLRLTEGPDKIVRQYCRDHDNREQSAAIRTAIDLLGETMNLSDIIETSCANLLDIAKVFDDIKGPTSPIYAEAIKEAAALLWAFCYNGHLRNPLEIKVVDQLPDTPSL